MCFLGEEVGDTLVASSPRAVGVVPCWMEP